MRNFIAITNEGYTFQPNSEEIEPDIENCQVIGFTQGANEEQAFKNLINENQYLLETNFNKIILYELVSKYEQNSSFFYISDLKG